MAKTKADIEQAIKRVALRFNHRLNVDWLGGKARILREDNGRYLSSRCTKLEAIIWLEGFESGLDEMELKTRREVAQ